MNIITAIIIGASFGLTFGGALGTAKVVSKFLPIHAKLTSAIREALEYKLMHAALQRKWNELVERINNKGGEAFLNSAPSKQLLTAPEIKAMLSLCHPDKHGGSKIAEDVTRKLLEFRGKA